jgi:hypothetical protein
LIIQRLGVQNVGALAESITSKVAELGDFYLRVKYVLDT